MESGVLNMEEVSGEQRQKKSLRQVMLESWGTSHKGTVREENQDAFLNWPEFKIWSVADGLGGSARGGEASKLVTELLMQIREPDSLENHVRQTRKKVEQANAFLIEQSLLDESGSNGATTLVCLLMHEGMAACLWSGDSRCYLLRGGVLYQCTKDHTLRQHKIDTGELTVPEAQRMVKNNLITNAIGVSTRVQLEEIRLQLLPGDRFLLCSDGLTGLLDAESLAVHMGGFTAKDCVDNIMEAVSHMPQPDNITLVVVCLSGKI